MSEKGRHRVKPYYVLAISVFFSAIGAMYASSYWVLLGPSSLLPSTAISGFLSFLLFYVMRSGEMARAAADEKAKELAKAKTAEDRLNSQLEQHRTKLKELISQMPGVVWEMHGRPETALRLTFISEYAERILGYSVGEWTETPNFWMTVVHPEDRSRVSRAR